MKIINNININFNSESNRVYELTVICKNEVELNSIFKKFENRKYYTLDNFEELEITLISRSYYHNTKKEFIKEVKKIIKKD